MKKHVTVDADEIKEVSGGGVININNQLTQGDLDKGKSAATTNNVESQRQWPPASKSPAQTLAKQDLKYIAGGTMAPVDNKKDEMRDRSMRENWERRK